MAFAVSETIEKPRPEVWSAVTDWKRAPAWMDGVEALRPLDDGPVGTGTRLGFRSRGAERQTTIDAWEPDRRLLLCSRQGGITAHYDYRFTDCTEGTHVTLQAECRGESLGWRLISPLIGFLMARADRGQLRALKEMIESA